MARAMKIAVGGRLVALNQQFTESRYEGYAGRAVNGVMRLRARN